MNPPRPGKKLLVLDLDYSMYFWTEHLTVQLTRIPSHIKALVDSKPLLAGALPPMECLRPFLHDFLEQAVRQGGPCRGSPVADFSRDVVLGL